MEITQHRKIFTDKSTISTVDIDGLPECFFLEDAVRDVKIPGKTAIPYGRYKIVVTKSNRFSQLAGKDVYLPLLLNVPGFDGVRIHAGNRPEDTEGCLLTGTAYGTNQVMNSRTAFIQLNEKINQVLKAGEDVWITINKVEI